MSDAKPKSCLLCETPAKPIVCDSCMEDISNRIPETADDARKTLSSIVEMAISLEMYLHRRGKQCVKRDSGSDHVDCERISSKTAHERQIKKQRTCPVCDKQLDAAKDVTVSFGDANERNVLILSLCRKCWVDGEPDVVAGAYALGVTLATYG